MPYYTQIYDQGASLMIAFDASIVKYVLKQDITGLTTINEDKFKIEVSSGRHIYLRYIDIMIPSSSSIHDLVTQVNSYITNCVCSGSTEPPPAD